MVIRMVEDEEAVPRTLRSKPIDLEDMSIEDLKEYIVELGIEIERVQLSINKKEKQKLVADAVFQR